jgi:hypothetical protein
MGGKVATRIMAGVFSGGISEAAQKKPFQPKSDINKKAVGVEGLGTFLGDPIHAVAKGVGRATTPSSPDIPPAPGTPIAPPRAQNAQEEEDARRRAFDARRMLGEGPRPSHQLTGSLG